MTICSFAALAAPVAASGAHHDTSDAGIIAAVQKGDSRPRILRIAAHSVAAARTRQADMFEPEPSISQALPDHNLSVYRRVLGEWRQLGALGGPILVAQLALMANSVIDTVMAGRAGAIDLAGVGIGASFWVPVLMFFAGTLSALQPTISGHRGAGEPQRIVPAVWAGIYIACAGMVLMALVVLNLRPVLSLLQLDLDTARVVVGYLKAFAWGIPALLLFQALRGLTDGLGHTRVFMGFSVLATLFNLPLNYLFINGGNLGFVVVPALGGIGCGWATSLSNWFACLAYVGYLACSRAYAHLSLSAQWVAPDWRAIVGLLRLGLPIGFTVFVEVSMFCMIALFLAPLGATTVAGHQIVLNLTSLTFMVPLSLGMALTLRVSFLVGAGDHSQARLLAKSSLALALAISAVNVPVLLLGRDWFASLYTSDPAVQQLAAQLFVLAAVFQIGDVIQVTQICVQRGYKDTKIPMVIMVLSFWGVSLPLGYLLTFTDRLVKPLGAAGFWSGLIVGLFCAAILLTWRVWRYPRPG